MKLSEGFNLLATAPDGIKRLRELILSLAVQGKLVPQDPSDQPASELLKQIRAEKDRLISKGKIRKDKPLPEIGDNEKPFELPEGWAWGRLNDIIHINSGDGLTSTQMAASGQVPVYGGNGVTGFHNVGNVSEPTLVIGRVGYYCGSIHITPEIAWVTDNAFITQFPPKHIYMVIQRKTQRPVQFELTEPTRLAVAAWMEKAHLRGDQYLFPSRVKCSPHISTRQYARIVHHWVEAVGLDSSIYGTHSMRWRFLSKRRSEPASAAVHIFASGRFPLSFRTGTIVQKWT